MASVVLTQNLKYYRDADATASVLRGGYFHSGDLAVKHADGSIAIQDRSKDLINSGGEKASSVSIEQGTSRFAVDHTNYNGIPNRTRRPSGRTRSIRRRPTPFNLGRATHGVRCPTAELKIGH